MRTFFNYITIYLIFLSSTPTFCQATYSLTEADSLTSDLFSALDSDGRKYKFYFFGELHGCSVNPDVRYVSIDYLSKNKNLRYILWEDGPSFAYLLNKYIISGNDNLLDSIMVNFLYDTEEERLMFRRLYQLNQTLQDSDKIAVIGIDVDWRNGYKGVVWCLKNLLSSCNSSPAKKYINEYSRLRLGLRSGYDEEVRLELKKITEDMEKDILGRPDYWKVLLGSEYNSFMIIIRNLIKSTDYKSFDEFIYERDRIMVDNFLEQTKDHSKSVVYTAQFGLHHINTFDYDGKKEIFTKRLFGYFDKGLFFTCPIVYKNCRPGMPPSVRKQILKEFGVEKNTVTKRHGLFLVKPESRAFDQYNHSALLLVKGYGKRTKLRRHH